ncbi:nuclear transport factor 2 family protein [Sphaerimonospora cavernae]|uniref:Nuclear transport factor 2 family protein n=1 Tax=Sphaerimonospora cavernae TaxID=1740611 RepID=A0ABV6UDG6_9ACTN
MPLNRDKVVEVCDAYIAAMSSHDADRIVALFSPTATHEEPIDTPVRHGHDEIRAFVAKHTHMGFTLTRMGPVTVVGNRGAFQVRVDIPTPDGGRAVTATDMITVGDDGLISGIVVLPDAQAVPE